MNSEERLKQMMDAARVESEPTPTDWNVFSGRAHRSLYLRRAGVVGGALALIAVGAVAAIVLTSNPLAEGTIGPATGTGETAEPAETREVQESSSFPIAAAEQELWFIQGERLSWGTAVMGGEVEVQLLVDEDPVAAEAAFWLQRLLEGPTPPDIEAGATTAIPEGTELLGVSQNGGALQVDLSSEFESGGGSLSIMLRTAQVVYTATQFEDVELVRFFIEGRPVEAIGGEGLIATGGLTRRDFQENYIAPNIVVEEPKPGDEISSGSTLRGFANVFEANVNYRVLNENGEALVEEFTTATCGSGCWGDFEATLDFSVDSRQEGRIEVLTFSAEDGSEQDVISIPVVLVP